jgi:precorrin-2 dehydrogenase/sirohydrochlorin ferrochelatase
MHLRYFGRQQFPWGTMPRVRRKGSLLRYYPLFLDISRRLCVVVGGGNVAERKVGRLLACGAQVKVIGRLLTPALEALKEEGRIVHHEADYEEGLIRGAFLVIGATDNMAINGQIADDARDLGILVNIVDDPTRCDFIVPSVLEQGNLTIAVSTGGSSPALARKLRADLEAVYGPEYAILLRIMGDLREKVIVSEASPAENRERFEALVSSNILDLIRASRWEDVNLLIMQLTGIEMEVQL